MRWKKLGLVYGPSGKHAWAKTHAMLPTPFALNEDTIRVFVTQCDSEGRGRPGYVDLDARNPQRVLGVSDEPLLDIGAPGSFDDNGVAVTSVVSPEAGTFFMYYAGFELCTKVRYRMLTGMAISTDGGRVFRKVSRAPILERNDQELLFRCGSFVAIEMNRFRMWYVGGSDWTLIGGKSMPVYDMRYLESSDGVQWSGAGRTCLAITEPDEHGFGRPWVVNQGASHYQLFYSIRRRSLQAYRIGLAESSDGLNWHRKDAEAGLDVTPGSFDGSAVMYSAVITAHGRTYCFYNGDNFGEQGFAVAALQS